MGPLGDFPDPDAPASVHLHHLDHQMQPVLVPDGGQQLLAAAELFRQLFYLVHQPTRFPVAASK